MTGPTPRVLNLTPQSGLSEHLKTVLAYSVLVAWRRREAASLWAQAECLDEMVISSLIRLQGCSVEGEGGGGRVWASVETCDTSLAVGGDCKLKCNPLLQQDFKHGSRYTTCRAEFV